MSNIEQNRINLIGPFLTREFGQKTVKLSLDGGFTCPNRDGTKGSGGCSFCSERGSGDNASTIQEQIELLSSKWKNASSYIAYFQNFTGTYAPVSRLRSLYYDALSSDNINGIAIATRPDCLGPDVLDLLTEINESHYMWIELGLQTTRDDIARKFGRGYETEVYYQAVDHLKERGIPFVTHLLFGLPGETTNDMKSSLLSVLEHGVWGLKFHLLNIIKGTRLYQEMPDYASFSTPEEYASLIVDLLEMVPYDIVIHRLSADSPADLLHTPKWAYRKRLLLNMIHQEMVRRDTIQGAKAKSYSPGTIISGPRRPSL